MTPSVSIAGGRRVTRWSRESIVEKIREWAAAYGDPPSSADWNPSLARWRAAEWRIERYRSGTWPSTNAVKRHFDGSFDAAVRAAGFEPARPGPKRSAHEARPAVAERRAPAHAEVRVRAALDQADAAARDAEFWRLEAEGARAALSRAEARSAGCPEPTGPAGPAVLAAALRDLAGARTRGDRFGLRAALGDVAAAAIAWRDRL
jgi:hypothetical protein